MPSASANSAAHSAAQPATDKNERWVARFGWVIAQYGIAAIPQALFYYQGQLGLSAQEIWFVCCLLADKWDGDLPHTSLKLLAKSSSLSLCQIRRIRGSLEEKDYLQVVQSFNGQQAQQSNCYDLAGLFQELERLIANDPAHVNEIQAESIPPYLRSLSGDWSFLERYGRVLIQRGIATIPQALFAYQADLGLTPQQIWFCCYVLAHKWDTEYPYPSLSKMAERTGYRRTSLQDIKDQLIRHGYLRLVPRSNRDGGQESNGYDFNGLLTALADLLQKMQTAPALTSQPDVRSEDEDQPTHRRGRRMLMLTKNASAVTEEGGASTRQGGSASTRQGRGASTRQGGSAPARQTGGAPALQAGSAPTRQAGGAPARHEEESDQEESDQKESDQNGFDSDSYPLSTAAEAERNQAPAFSPWIAGVIMDYSREMGSLAQTQSSTTQALRIWQDSGLSEERFVELLHQAKVTTRQYQGKQGQGSIANRMGYLFVVLRHLVGQDGSAPAASEAAP